MAFNKRFRGQSSRTRNINCSCGSEAKLTSRKNYPHGQKSKARTSWYYKCKSCGKIKYLDK